VIRVLHVLEALEGGTARHLVDLVRHADGVEHHAAIPTERTSGVTDRLAAGQIREAGGTVHVVPMDRRPLRAGNATAQRSLRRLVFATGADVVHGHSSIGGALARVATAGTRVPVVYTPNGLATSRAALAVEHLLGRRTRALIAVSDSEADLVRRLGLVDEGRLHLVRNGIELEPPPPLDPTLRHRLGLDPATPVVGTIARLVPQKAPALFVQTCAAVAQARPDARFVLIGAGPLQAELDAALARTGLGARFHHLPELPGAARALGELDVFVLHSRFEGGPYTVLEAMRAGVPVVVSDVVGNRDAVDPAGSGRVVPFGDVAATADAVTSLLDDPVAGAALAEAARRRLAERFDVRRMGAETVTVYRSVLAPVSPGGAGAA
jgi:glycosyltransferase involved in cell wall biosynthesis